MSEVRITPFTPKRQGLHAVRLCLLMGAVSAVSTQCEAHPLHLTTLTIRTEAKLTRVTAVVHPAHLSGAKAETAIRERLRLRLDGTPFRPSSTVVSSDEPGSTVTWEAVEARSASVVAVDAPLFPDSPGDSTMVAFYRNGELTGQATLSPDSPSAILSEAGWAEMQRFVWMGMHHILSGLDHVLFVLGLLLISGTLRGLLGVITAFTVAHSITLSLTVLGIGSLPSWFVEPVIALSIVAVGAENLMRGKIHFERRVWLAFGFGFFHGFGFAGALTEAGLPRDAVAWPLAWFNIGVEMGQAFLVLVLSPVLRLARDWNPVVCSTATRYASLGIAAAGTLWFVERIGV